MTPSEGMAPPSALSTEAAICVPTRAWLGVRVRVRVGVTVRVTVREAAICVPTRACAS